MSPSPPVWIRINITIFPKEDHPVNVSFIVRPVTQVAEVDVYKASRKETFWPILEDIGRYKRIAPKVTIVMKLKHTVLAGFFVRKFFLLRISIIKSRPP